MNSIRRFVARTSSLVACAVLLATGAARAGSASYLFEGRPLAFTHLSHAAGAAAVGINDPGLRSLLRSLGALITWRPGERYVLITTAQAQIISFSVGDRSYDVGPLTSNAHFAPYLLGTEVYLPFADLLHALSLAPERDGGTTVLERELTSIDVRGSGGEAIVVARGAGSLTGHLVHEGASSLVYEFDGVGSTLAGTRSVNAGGVRSLDVRVAGSVRAPKTFVTLALAPGTKHDPPRSNNGDFELAFGAAGSAPPLLAGASAPVAVAQPTAAPAAFATDTPLPGPSLAPDASASTPASAAAPQGVATVGTVSVATTATGATVTIPVTGNAQFAWHRLRAPDNRFWIDISNAQLASGPVDQAEADPVTALRVRQNDAQTVRVALSVDGAKDISVSPSATGIVIGVGNDVVADAPRFGSGSVGTLVSSNEPQPLVTPVPPDEYGEYPSIADADWKFGPPSAYVPTNPKLIVIDPGHGGADIGSTRNGVTEASLTLDMAKRLQAILVARGWQVQLTHDTNVDVKRTAQSSQEAISDGYHSTDAQDLQARDDIANNAGARLFVSIHVNAFINSGPSGTTTYYSKPSDVALAQIVQRDLGANLGTKNDGIIKSRLYVTLHAKMPAVLIETAFISNPDDFAKLTSPDWRQKVAETIADGIDQYTARYPVQSANQ